MAVLNKIRQRSLILILVIALALFSFVIGDLFKNSDALTGGSQDVVATINGKDINRIEFQQKVKSYQDRSGGRQSSTQAMNAIYSQELRSIVLESEFEALGLSVEKDEMRDLLKNSFSTYPEFQDENGVFDVNRLNAYISNLKDLKGDSAPLGNFQVNYSSWINNEQGIATNAIQQSYYNLIKAGVGATITEAENEYLGDAKSVDISFVQIPYTSITDSLVDVKKSDIKNYITANSEKYQVDATREIAYVEFKEEASKADEDAIKAGLLSLKNDRSEYNESSKNTETIPGFASTTNVTEFVNSNSDINFNDTFLRASELPITAKDSLMGLKVGDFYGPYRDGKYLKLSKVLAIKQLPDSVKVRHILIPYVGASRADVAITQTKEEAFATADSILDLVLNNRPKFVDLLDLSSDKASNEKKGVIEFAYNSSFAPEFKDFSFEEKKGAINVVETDFGFHVIEILNQSNYSKTLKIATLADKIEPSDQTLQDVFNTVSKFEIAAKDGDFNTLAKTSDLVMKPVTFKELDENLPGLGSQRDIVRWSFEEDAEVGDFKRFEVSNFGFIVAKLVKKVDKGLMSVEDASITALSEVRKEKKAKMIREKITGSTLADIAKNQGQTVKTAAAITMNNATLSGAGAEPKVIGTAFGLDQGETSKLIDGNKGVYVIQVNKLNEASKQDNYIGIVNRLNSAIKNSVQTKVYSALEKTADIEDFRAKTVY